MNTIQTAYVNALLADAAYVDVSVGINSADMRTRLTPTQAAYLAANFTVKASVETPNTINPALGTGFDAVVWEGKADTPYAGQTYVSMRGTQGGTDIADDASLASKGLPYDQIRDMVNWWLKSTASTTDQNVVQIKVVDIPGAVIGKTFALDTPTTGTGVLSGLGPITVNHRGQVLPFAPRQELSTLVARPGSTEVACDFSQAGGLHHARFRKNPKRSGHAAPA